MTKEEIEKKAFDYFNSGFNCAEAVFKTILESGGGEASAPPVNIASAFGGGVGGTHDELCGALAGGIIAIGYLLGRNEPGIDIRQAKELAAELRQCFIDRYGDTKCQTVLDKLGPQENGMKCKHLTGEVAGDLFLLLEESVFSNI